MGKFGERAKINAFVWIRSLTMILIMPLAYFTILKRVAISNVTLQKWGITNEHS
jgi:hypothetical protein